jgi:hypothetical protein
MLTINQDSSVTNKDAVQVEFIRFEYDVEKAAKAIEKTHLPNEYADMLRKDFKTLIHFQFRNNGKLYNPSNPHHFQWFLYLFMYLRDNGY